MFSKSVSNTVRSKKGEPANDPLGRTIEQLLKGSSYRTCGRINVLHLRGDDYQMGYQHGHYLKKQCQDGAPEYFRGLLKHIIENSDLQRYPGFISSLAYKYLEGMKLKGFSKRLSKSTKQEFSGLCDASGMPYEKMKMSAAIVDLTGYLMKITQGKQRLYGANINLPAMGCSTFAAWGDATKDGSMIIGRNMDFIGIGFWDKSPTLLYYHPRNGYDFVTLTSAGIPGGFLNSMNEKGLVITAHQNYTAELNLKNRPFLELGNELIRNASTIDEAVKIAERNLPIGGWTYLVASRKEKKAVVLEISGKQVITREAKKDFIHATNSYQTTEQKVNEILMGEGVAWNSSARYVQMKELLMEYYGKITPGRAAKIMGDHFDPYVKKKRPLGDILVQMVNLTSAVFQPEKGRIWMAEGEAPAANSLYRGFNMKGKEIQTLKPNDYTYTKHFKAVPHVVKACLFNYRKDIENAKKELKKALKFAPNEAVINRTLALVHLGEGNYEEAYELLKKLLKIKQSPYKFALSRIWFARCLDLMGKRKEAKESYSHISEETRNSDILRNAARKGLKKMFTQNDQKVMKVEFWIGESMAL